MARQLAPVDIVAPGKLGLNTEEAGKLLSPDYATKATNLVIEDGDLLSLRKGWTLATGTPITSTPNVESLFEYITAAGATEMICAWDGGIANDISDPEGNDVSGSVTDTNGTWWFQNFNDKCLGFQSGQKLIVYTGTTFATVSEAAGTAPTGGVAWCGYGRVWQVGSDGKTIYYSSLLDETTWTGGTAGSFDVSKIWTQGQDTITAIVGFNGLLVVFGKRHIIFLGDDTGSALGVDPANLYVTDVIAGTGCVDQQTVQLVGDADIVFLSTQGVQTLGRVIQEKSNPINTISHLNTTEIQEAYRAATAGTIRSAYSEDDGIYVLTFSGTVTFAFYIRRLYKDDEGRVLAPTFKWDLAPYSWCARENGNLLLGQAGVVGTYSGYDDNGSSITWIYESPWMDFGEEFGNRLKILKRLGFIFRTSWGGTVSIKWAVDFEPSFGSKNYTVTTTGGVSEWGVAEWNVDEWSGSLGLQIIKTPARKTGQYYKIQLSASMNSLFGIQQIELFTKLGRVA